MHHSESIIDLQKIRMKVILFDFVYNQDEFHRALSSRLNQNKLGDSMQEAMVDSNYSYALILSSYINTCRVTISLHTYRDMGLRLSTSPPP